MNQLLISDIMKIGNELSGQQRQDMLLNHIILPRILPQTKPAPFHRMELELMTQMVQNVVHLSEILPPKTVEVFRKLERIHCELTPQTITKEINALHPGDTFAMFVRRQNCTFIIHVPLGESYDVKESQNVIVATFPGNLHPSKVYEHDSDIEFNYPVQAIKVKFSQMLRSKDFAAQLCFFYSTLPKETKNRDYVSKWLVTLLGDEASTTATNDEFPVITKKVRDEVLGESKKDYFRRSSFYMSLKVLLQHSLTMQLGAETGKIIYKIVMLKFLVQMCNPYMETTCTAFNIDLLSQMLAKMARRIDKLSHMMDEANHNHLTDFYHATIGDAQEAIALIRAKIDGQIQLVHQKYENKSQLQPLNGLNFDADIKQEMPKLHEYLRIRKERGANEGNSSKYEVSSYRRYFTDRRPGTDTIDISRDELGRRVFWLEFENMVLYDVTMDDDQWTADEWRTWSFKYADYAESFYKGNQLFISRMVLVRLKIFSVLDIRAAKAHPLLLKYRSGINPNIINSMLLPQQNDMKIAYEIEQYFHQRNKNGLGPSLIGEQRVSRQSFSTKFAQSNPDMIQVRNSILASDSDNVRAKEEEWRARRREVESLRDRARRLSCEYTYSSRWGQQHSGSCEKCDLNRRADGIKIVQYEHLLPIDEFEQYAVAFELRIPNVIACLRDILFGFTKYCSGSAECLNIKGTWVSERSEVSRHNQSTSRYVKLGSTTRGSMTNFHVDCSFETFIVNNTFNCTFYASNSSMPKSISDNSIKNACTFQTTAEYQSLQWMLNSTGHTQNQVLSYQCKCPQDLCLSEYKNFGSLRSDGHRLQLRKLYAMIETEALSFQKESVLLLIMQTLWECGISGEAHFIRESHIDFNEPTFCSQMIELLQKYVQKQRSNWKNPFKFLMITLIATRAYEINDAESVANDIVDLLNCIRSIILDSSEKIDNAIHGMENPDENIERDLRLKLIYATIAGALTFFVHPRHIHYHRIFAHNVDNDLTASHLWLQFIITLKNNVLMYTSNESQLPSNLRMFLRLVESIGVYLEPTMTTTIEQDTSMIHDLIRKQWSRAVGASFTSIEFHGTFPQILVVEAMLGPATQIVTIDIIAGIFLVDGLPLCRLPSEITQSEVYRWFFANVAFEVQPDAQNNYSTVQKYNGCSYDFKKAEKIIITERTAEGAEKELIHHENLKGDFPYLLVINYSHWWNQDKNCIEFRKRTFGREHFSKETSIDYELDLSNSRLVHVATGRPMLDIKSNSYINIMKQLIRLEHRKYIHVLMDSSQLAKVELVRMNLKFKIDGSKMSDIDYDLESNEFSGMRVSCTQNIGTLYGLNHGLILESSTDANTRMLLIPHGNIRTECTETHVTVDVDTENELRNPPFFQYQVDEFCKQIKANNRSYSSWFYLAYLHAVTSHGEVEPFIGMSGTERALQILQSSFCWSPSPYEPEAVKILTATAELTPVRNLKENYYQIVAWPKRVHPRAAQDCFVFIVKKLFADSQRMPELYFKDSKTFNTKGNLRLNERDHRRCQQLNPNLCVLSTFIEHKDLKTSLPKPIYVSFAPNTQTVSILYHRKEYSVPSSLELKSFLTGGLQLNGIANMQCLPNLLIHNVYEGFRDLWIRLYDAARKQQFNSEQFALIMSVFAHENEKIEQICSLQSVAMNPNAFADIDPPQVNVFEISKGTCEAHKVSSIIRECHIKPHEYDYHEWYETGKRRAHDHELDAIIRKITDEVTRSWPCDSVNLIGKWSFSFIDFQKANAAINVMLTIWNNNRRLGIFIDKVEERLKSLAVSGLDITLPVYSPFVEPVPRNWCKFKIDFDEKARESLNSFGEAIEEARYVWETKTDESTRTAKEWWTIIENILNSGKSTHFIQAGTFPRMVPSLLLPRIATKETDERLKALIGAWAMAIAHEQRDKRIELYSQRNELKAAMDKEIENKPHLNWKPSKYPEWLLFEIEQNLTIRRIQIEVAERMIEPPKKVGNDAKHSVMQLNMGEGKTAVIVPILAAVLADGTQACQIVVLKSLFATNLNSLRQYLGGMLNRRIYTFPCRRDMPITQYCDQMLSIYEECKREKGVIITLPEYFLSFQLKMYELIQKGNIAAAQRVLNVVKWIHENVRIILDESDAILQPKYQLIYTVGNQMPPDGGSQRWIIAQAILKRVPYHMERLCAKYGEKMIEFDSKYVENGHVFGSPTVNFRSDVFTPCRIIDGSMFEKLKSELIEDFLDGRLDIDFSEIVASKKEPLKLILNERAIDKRSFEVVKDFSLTEQNIVLILSGLLRFEVLKLVLTKRWRVNYGVDENGRRKMAIPFKAKDVAAELTEFGHPDVAICFTQMSYYYSGLTDAQLYKVFSVLENTQDAAATYEKWIQSISPKLIDASIQSYTGVNLDDPNQRDTLLFPLLRFNMHVVDFWLSNVVFPHEMKIFENKLMCTAWDLCSDRLQQRVTGFSGTNDTKNILPLPIQQNDLEELESTNENMRQILLRPENQTYECLPSNVSGKQILERLIERHIPVLLDSGALMLELNNQQVAIEWLKMSPFTSFDAAVYFDSKDVLQTIDRSGNVTAFDCSVYRENLSKCLVYLDDVHTRGTDLKFPLKWKACVTLSGDITRDKTVQSCMRMRQLGKTHSISFWASFETNIRIRKICDLSPDHQVTNENVIDFICSNSRHFETANMVHWAAAAFNYTKKLIGHKMFENIPDENSLTELYRICVDNEFVELSKMYGDKEEALLIQIAQSKLDNLAENLPADEEVRSQIEETKSKLIDKLNEQAPNLKQFTHALDEEQEKELEQELEEQREVERPPPAQAATPIFDQRLVQLVRDGSNDGIIASMKRDGALLSIAKSLSHTQLFRFCANNEDAWADHLLVTKDFKTVIVSSSPTCDEFLRPVWWIGQVKSANGKQDILMLLSSHECNHLLPIFRKSTKATLFVYRPRLSKFHSNLLHEPKLQVPELSEVSRIDIDDEVQIGIYAGMMYFCSEAEQDVYCGFLGLIPRPRTTEQDKAFEEGLIQPKGFVPMENRQHSEAISSCVGQCKFKDNPVDLAIKLIEAHHQALPKMSHAASILVRGIKRNDITGEEKEDYFKEWLLTQTQRN